MITEVIVNNNQKSPFNYLHTLPNFYNGKKFEFKPYINIIVGFNGSGKSTLMKLISTFMLNTKSMSSEFPNEFYFSELKMFDYGGRFLDGVDIKSDYLGTCFKFKPFSELGTDERQNNIRNFALTFDGYHSSVGEQTIEAMSSLFEYMYSKEVDLKFPIEVLKSKIQSSNENWKESLTHLLKYYEKNKIEVKNKEEFQYTLLMDEPDRNLDIDNIEQVFGILSHQKEHTQIIAIIHNPILIYKLSKLDFINFIEMEEGYLNKIKNFVEKIDKYTKIKK